MSQMIIDKMNKQAGAFPAEIKMANELTDKEEVEFTKRKHVPPTEVDKPSLLSTFFTFTEFFQIIVFY